MLSNCIVLSAYPFLSSSSFLSAVVVGKKGQVAVAVYQRNIMHFSIIIIILLHYTRAREEQRDECASTAINIHTIAYFFMF